MLACLGRVAVMAAIVATLLFVPAALGGALVILMLGFSPEAFATFGGALHPLLGLCAWWLAAFVGASAYAAFAFPWDEKVLAWPKKN
jgi:hypothetical protein